MQGSDAQVAARRVQSVIASASGSCDVMEPRARWIRGSQCAEMLQPIKENFPTRSFFDRSEPTLNTQTYL
jgi:hypothetical protein